MHSYTLMLLTAVPKLDEEIQTDITEGAKIPIIDPIETGCKYYSLCTIAKDECKNEPISTIKSTEKGLKMLINLIIFKPLKVEKSIGKWFYLGGGGDKWSVCSSVLAVSLISTRYSIISSTLQSRILQSMSMVWVETKLFFLSRPICPALTL